jgi:hypothetical protein
MMPAMRGAAQSPADDPVAGLGRLEREVMVQSVLERNPGLEAARQAWRAAGARVPQARALADPMLSYGIAPLSLGSEGSPLGQSIEVRQDLPYPGKRDVRGRMAEAEAEGILSDYRTALLELAATAALLFEDYRLVYRAIEWAGQFTYFERAKERLKVVVPVTLLIIVFLLYLNTRSVVETGIVLLAVPFSLIGAVWLLYLLGYNLSVAVWVGLIALAGIDAETGVVMLLYLTISHRQWRKEGRLRDFADLKESIVEGAAQRIRPKLITVLTDMVGLLPVMLSTGTGADLMKRIAAPLVGGLATSFLLELTVYPAIFAIWKKRSLPESGQTLSRGQKERTSS